MCQPLPMSEPPLPFNWAKLPGRWAEHTCHDKNNLESTAIAKSCSHSPPPPPTTALSGETISCSSTALWHSSAPAPQMAPAPRGLSATFTPFSAGRWKVVGNRVVLERGKGWEARCGPQNRASQKTCLCELYECPACSLPAHLRASGAGEGGESGKPANSGDRVAWHRP